jgi:hypothetical protein
MRSLIGGPGMRFSSTAVRGFPRFCCHSLTKSSTNILFLQTFFEHHYRVLLHLDWSFKSVNYLNEKEDFALEEVNKLSRFNRSYYVGIYRRTVENESHFISCFGFVIIMIFMEKEIVFLSLTLVTFGQI